MFWPIPWESLHSIIIIIVIVAHHHHRLPRSCFVTCMLLTTLNMFLNASVSLIHSKHLQLTPCQPSSQPVVPVIHLFAVNSVPTFPLLTPESSIPQTLLSTGFQLGVADWGHW